MDLPLEELWIRGTDVVDLSPLRGRPLLVLYRDVTAVTEVSVLGRIPTLESKLPEQARDHAPLRHLPNLREISYRFDQQRQRPAQSSTEFWAEPERK